MKAITALEWKSERLLRLLYDPLDKPENDDRRRQSSITSVPSGAPLLTYGTTHLEAILIRREPVGLTPTRQASSDAF